MTKKAKIEELRQEILKNGCDHIRRIFNRLERGNDPFCGRGDEEVFKTIVRLIEQEDSPVNFEFKGGSINEQIDCLMKAISCGRLTPNQGSVLMGILRSGFEVTEVSELKALLEDQRPVNDVNVIDYESIKVSGTDKGETEKG